jgi:hypothetical protein
MEYAPARLLPGTETDPEALIKEARRRQRRRYVAAGAAVAVALGAAAGVLAGLHGPGSSGHGRPGRPGHRRSLAARRVLRGPAPIPASVGTTVLMWPAGYPAFTPAGGPPAYVDDLSTDRLTQSGAVDISAGDYQPLLVPPRAWSPMGRAAPRRSPRHTRLTWPRRATTRATGC